MKGFIEIKDDQYEDTIEHLKRIKILSCKLIKMLSENSEVYDDEEDTEEEPRSRKKSRGRYEY